MANLYEEVQLWKTPSEREKIRNLAEVYALINTLQFLQKAYIKDCIKEQEYATSCRKLLSQFKGAFSLVKSEFLTVESFVEKYKMDCPGALKVINEGLTIEDRDKKLLIRCTELFITTIDRLNMDQLAKDQIQPDIRNLWECMHGLSFIPSDFDGKKRIKHWLDVMEPMDASEELSPTQGRQLLFDMETSFDKFKSITP
ncbi:Vacuolar protein sorting associated protein [Echinococcus multilocularis]|uniref:Vacuolar protein sorting-associated protein 28 homolog n=1 Tax=Echinococcus multilocularis TaxID=6211 RepID=A0A068Y2A8_ECHMU|nr:Vacuolar protein sorting associated protein [Echinococcus multilocularis]